MPLSLMCASITAGKAIKHKGEVAGKFNVSLLDHLIVTGDMSIMALLMKE